MKKLYESVHTVAEELVQLWIWCNVDTISTARVGSKTQQLMKEFNNLDRYPQNQTWYSISAKRSNVYEKNGEFI